jgi:hypothetical protein
MYDYHGDNKNNKNRDEYKGLDSQALEKYRDKVETYFDLECSLDRPLIDYVSDGEGEANIFLINKLSDIILSFFLKKDSVNNCAMAISDYLAEYGA